MSLFNRGRVALFSVILALLVPSACGSSGVVGGTCAPGYVLCDGRCTNLQSDPRNCSACGNACDPEEGCRKGVCRFSTNGDAGEGGGGGSGGGQSGAAGDSGLSGDTGTSGSGTGASSGSGGSSAASSGGTSGGDNAGDTGLAGAASCQPPYDQPEACGDCTTQCQGATPLCAPDGMGGFQCVPVCVNPLQECNGQCVDYNIDPNNCGSCGHVCPSGICQGGMCVGANVGHVVLACMNYQSPTKNAAQTVLIGNAVFLPIKNPVRILAYTQFATPATRAKVDLDIGYAGMARGRTFTITPLNNYLNASAVLDIKNYDVFLIYDQSSAPAGQMAMVGGAWQTSSVVDSFNAAGGIVIGLSGGSSEMDQFFTASGLLNVSAQSVVTGSTLYNRAAADAIASNVVSLFLAPADSCTFTTNLVPDADNIFVVRDTPAPAAGKPVVVHRVITP